MTRRRKTQGLCLRHSPDVHGIRHLFAPRLESLARDSGDVCGGIFGERITSAEVRYEGAIPSAKIGMNHTCWHFMMLTNSPCIQVTPPTGAAAGAGAGPGEES